MHEVQNVEETQGEGRRGGGEVNGENLGGVQQSSLREWRDEG